MNSPPACQAGAEAPACRLVVAARNGDREAFGELYERFSRAVHGVLITRVPIEDAGDLVQDVFIHAWPRLSELREPAAFGGWICAIARWRAADHHRRAHPTLQLVDNVAAGDRPDVTAEAHNALAAIQTLPEAYRETLVLRLVDGLSGPEVADATGLTPDSVRVVEELARCVSAEPERTLTVWT